MKEKEIQRVRVEKSIPFPEAKKLVEAMSPSVVPSCGVVCASVTQSKRTVVVSSASCQTDLTWILSKAHQPVRRTTVAVQSAPTVLSVNGSIEKEKGLAEPDFQNIGHRISPCPIGCWPS